MHIRVVHDFTQGERGGIDDEFKKKSNSNFHFCKILNVCHKKTTSGK